jgi:hypothetical protein
MTAQAASRSCRWIGLDVHKHYLVAIGVDQDKNVVFGPQRVQYPQLAAWIAKHLTPQDAVVLEMTTNAYQLYDDLLPHVGSVTVVHPPGRGVDRARAGQDRPQSRPGPRPTARRGAPARHLGAAGRGARAAGAHRPTGQDEQARHPGQEPAPVALHRYHILPPEGLELYAPDVRAWWLLLPLTPLEKVRVQCDLDTLAFAKGQVTRLEQAIAEQAATTSACRC